MENGVSFPLAFKSTREFYGETPEALAAILREASTRYLASAARAGSTREEGRARAVQNLQQYLDRLAPPRHTPPRSSRVTPG